MRGLSRPKDGVLYARLCRGHPRLHYIAASKTWMAGINPAMTLRVNPAMTLRVWARASHPSCTSIAVRRTACFTHAYVAGIHAFTTSQQARRGWHSKQTWMAGI